MSVHCKISTQKKHVLGTFTISFPNYYSHVLIVVCPLTNFLLTYPLKSKKLNMYVFHFLYNIFQLFNVKYFFADNGPCFSHVDLLTLLHVLNIKRIGIGAYHPESNGKAESYVKSLNMC